MPELTTFVNGAADAALDDFDVLTDSQAGALGTVLDAKTLNHLQASIRATEVEMLARLGVMKGATYTPNPNPGVLRVRGSVVTPTQEGGWVQIQGMPYVQSSTLYLTAPVVWRGKRSPSATITLSNLNVYIGNNLQSGWTTWTYQQSAYGVSLGAFKAEALNPNVGAYLVILQYVVSG